jgi:ferric iron reductase protein FhuF
MSTEPLATASPFPVAAGRPAGEEWLPATSLLEPGSPLLEERIRAFGKQLGTGRRGVALSLLLESYTSLLASLAFGALVGLGRAPELGVANVSVRLESGGVPDALAVHDPRPREGLDRLEGVAASLLDRHLAVLVARLEELRGGRGRHALWGLVAGACAAAIIDAVERAGEPPERARALTAALFALPGSSLPGPPRVLEVRGATDGRVRLVRKRPTCCLSYALAGCDFCATCPVWSDARATELAGERLALLPW